MERYWFRIHITCFKNVCIILVFENYLHYNNEKLSHYKINAAVICKLVIK